MDEAPEKEVHRQGVEGRVEAGGGGEGDSSPRSFFVSVRLRPLIWGLFVCLSELRLFHANSAGDDV